MSSRLKSYYFIPLIAAYGLSKHWLSSFYAKKVKIFLNWVGFEDDQIVFSLNYFRQTDAWRDEILGWFIYHPTYVTLHICYLYFHYQEVPRLRFKIIVAFISTLLLFLILAVVMKVSGQETLYQMVLRPIHLIFSVPFLLFLFEGGRILIRDFNRSFEK